MGNDQKQIVIQQNKIQQTQLRQQIQKHIKQKRLHWSHQSNIYIKFQYLTSHFGEFQIEQIILDQFIDHNMISNELMLLLSQIDLNNLKSKIKVICLSFNEIVCESLKCIVNFHLIHLTSLFLDNNNISNDGCYYLTKPRFQSLQTLDLTSNSIGEEGARHLATSNWPQLKTLLISSNKLSAKGFLYLSRGQWPQLVFIQAKNNNFQVTKKLQTTKFRTQINGFRIELE